MPLNELPVELRQQITEFLTSLSSIHDSASQRSFIAIASLDANLLGQLNFGLPAGQFVSLLLSTLTSYGTLRDGRNALVAVLEAAKQQVGQDRQADCNRLIDALRARSSSASSSTTSERSLATVNQTDMLNRLYQTFRHEGPDKWTSSTQVCKELNISQEQLNDFILELKTKGFLEAKFVGQKALLRITPDGVAIMK